MKLCFAHAGTEMVDVSPSWAQSTSLLCCQWRPVDVSQHLPAVKGCALRQQGVEDAHQCSRRAKFAKLRRSKNANSGRLKFANLSQSKRANHKISMAQIGCSGYG